MKSILISLMCSMVFLASFQNSLMFLDYQINRDFYETHCINKDKPEMNCHGKCQVTKNTSDPTVPLHIVKISFEFSFIPQKFLELHTVPVKEFHHPELFYYSDKGFSEGYLLGILRPPRI